MAPKQAPQQAPQTDLSSQLAQLAVRQGVEQAKPHRGRASLLYSFQEAADIDAETVYRIGVEGLDQLCDLDGRFQAYRRTLFGQASQSLDRDAATADVNAKLDAAIAGFCMLLSSYFLLDPAFKALEFLVRKYKVHERNVDELMLAALPYHETEQFVRLVQVLRLGPRSRWAFLEPMQASGAPAPREALVLRCATDRSLLRFVCDMAQRQADPRVAGRVALPFYSVLLCEFLGKAKAVDEPLLTMLLPYLLAGLSTSAVADYRSATYMVVGHLACRATFSSDLATALVTETCRSASPGLLGSVAMLLAHLANSQEHLVELPEKAFMSLAKVTGLVDHLAALGAKGCRIEALLSLLVQAAMAQLQARPAYEQLLQGLLTRVPMGAAASKLADLVLQQAGGTADEDPHREVLQRLLRTLDLRYPEALDAAVDSALPRGASGDQGEGEAGPAERQQRVLALLNAAFEGTARGSLLEAGTTLLLAAEAPTVAMRILAVQRLDSLLATTAGTEAGAAASAALLRRLHDDSPAVVQAVLGSASLLRLPPAALVDALAGCFDQAMQQAGDSGVRKAQRAEARGVARKALKLLTGPVLEGSPQLTLHVLPLLLAALQISQACGRKVVATALKSARSLDSPLLAGLHGLPVPQEGGSQEDSQPAAKQKKGSKKGGAAGKQQVDASTGKAAADAAYNSRVIAAMASRAASDTAAAAQLSELLSSVTSGEAAPGARRAEPLLLMVAHAAVCSGGPGAAAVASGLLRQLHARGAAFEPAEALPTECFDGEGVATPALLERRPASQVGAATMLSTALMAALRSAPWEALAPAGDKDALGFLRTLCSAGWKAAQAALLQRMAEQQLDALDLLSELFAAPPGSEAVGVQLAAAQSAAVLLDQRPAAARGKKRSGGVTMRLLGRVLCALRHPERSVREAGLQCALAAIKHLQAGSLPDTVCTHLAAALSEQAELVASDAEALVQLLEILLGVTEHPPGLVLPPEAASQLGDALLAAVAEECSAAAAARGAACAVAAYCARLLLEPAAEWAPAQKLLATGAQLLRDAARIRVAQPGSPEGQQKELLLSAAAGCFSARHMQALLQSGGQEGLAAILDAWCGLLDPSGTAPAARLAALQHVEPSFVALLPTDVQSRLLQVLLRAASKDADEACRTAARQALASLPIHASTLLPLLSLEPAAAAGDGEGMAVDGVEDDSELQRLQAAAAEAAAKLGSPSPRQKRSKPSKEQAAAEEAARKAAEAVQQRQQQLEQQRQGRSLRAAAGSAAYDRCMAVLELLQWKENVEGRVLLIPAVQDVLSQALAASAAGSDEQADEPNPASLAAAGLPAAEIVYAMQLCLAVLTSLARAAASSTAAGGAAQPPAMASKARGKGRKPQRPEEQQDGIRAFDLDLAVRVAQQAPDGAVRNSALELVAALAQAAPEAMLGHVLQVVTVVGTSAALQDDEQSERVASRALHAILPAWLAAGNSVHEMAAAVAAALPKLSPHRRLSLLAALVAALPQVEGLCSVLALLLEQAVRQQEQPSDAPMAEADTALVAGAEAEPAWAVELAGDLMEQATVLVQVSVSAALLEHSLEASKQQAWQPLPLLSVAFVTQQLEHRRRAASAAAAEDLAAAYQELMQQCLLHLQRLGSQQAAQQKPKGEGAAAAPVALLRTGTAGCYRLLQALQQHMEPAAFLSALVSLATSSPADRVRRKALQLFVAAVQDVAADASWQEETEAAAAVAQAALSVCGPAVQLLASAGQGGAAPLTKQTALSAVGAVASAFGRQHAERLLEVLPAVLAAVGADQAAVRGSALAAAAALVSALGPRLVPLLPKTVAAVIAAVQSASAVVMAAAKQAGSTGQGRDEAGSSSGSEGEEGRGRSRKQQAAAPPVAEAAALELAAALAAVAALVQHLGAFLAPHLPALLDVLLHPAVLQCKAAKCSEIAAAIRQQLVEAVPTRLLLPALLAQLEAASQAGVEAVCGTLRMLLSAVDAMDSPALASHHEAVFAALLRALDLRRRRPASLLVSSDCLDRTEAAAVDCFVGLTMRLTEARFKPLFFRLLEWAHAVPAGDSDLPVGTGQLLRSVALFSLVNALAEKLRNVFVPYFGLLLDACLAHLSDGSVPAALKKGRKKRKSAAAEAGEGTAGPPTDALYVEHDWRLRLKVVHALHRCFLYDTGSGGAGRFLDEPRFQRLVPPLVAHLGLQPPADVVPALEGDGLADSAGDLAASMQLPGSEGQADGAPDTAALLDTFGRAVVACLAQLAVTAGNDAQWKPLNHQVLMMTRSLEPRTRLLALETVAQFVARLAEEYLVLLPETLPFLSELLEDSELALEARAQQVLRQLEELSGESLADYLS